MGGDQCPRGAPRRVCTGAADHREPGEIQCQAAWGSVDLGLWVDEKFVNFTVIFKGIHGVSSMKHMGMSLIQGWMIIINLLYRGSSPTMMRNPCSPTSAKQRQRVWNTVQMFIHFRMTFRSRTSDNMAGTDGKAEGRVREEKRREEERRSEKRKSQRKEDAGAQKGRTVAIHCGFSNDFRLRRVEK